MSTLFRIWAGFRSNNRATSWVLSVLLQVVLWTAIGMIFAIPYMLRGNEPMGTLVNWWLWGLATPLIALFDKRLPYSDKQLPKRLIALVIFGLFYVPALEMASIAVEYYLSFNKWNPFAQPISLLDWLLWYWLIYTLVVGVILARKYFKRYLTGELERERLERRFAEARLNALRMQLDPHFLFNALNAISSQVERDPKLARTMIEHLGDLLRLSLENRDRQLVPLCEEMAFVEHYLAIQKIRFGDRLRIETQIASDVRHALVPCLFVQPLVENAIRHGLSKRSTGGSVIISAERMDNRIRIRVRDDGMGLPPGWSLETSSGVGLSVTRERIAGQYPNGTSQFLVRPCPGGGTEVEITFPLRLIEQDIHEHAA